MLKRGLSPSVEKRFVNFRFINYVCCVQLVATLAASSCGWKTIFTIVRFVSPKRRGFVKISSHGEVYRFKLNFSSTVAAGDFV